MNDRKYETAGVLAAWTACGGAFEATAEGARRSCSPTTPIGPSRDGADESLLAHRYTTYGDCIEDGLQAHRYTRYGACAEDGPRDENLIA